MIPQFWMYTNTSIMKILKYFIQILFFFLLIVIIKDINDMKKFIILLASLLLITASLEAESTPMVFMAIDT